MIDARPTPRSRIATATGSERARLFACAAREIVLRGSRRAGVGHIGSSLSIADIVAVLYTEVLRIADPRDPERDRFVLSKGHAALALYAALHLRGWIDEAELATFCADGTRLSLHPEVGVPGVDFSTGSLGHGLAMGAGAALAARAAGSDRRVYVLVSDAECDEGSVWEAAMFAAHHRLANLVVIVDENGQQALGYTRDVLSLAPLAQRWAAFGWDARDVDGHDHTELAGMLRERPASGPPRVLVAHTTFGKGVSFMESAIEWHYRSMSEEQCEAALKEVAAACAGPSSGR